MLFISILEFPMALSYFNYKEFNLILRFFFFFCQVDKDLNFFAISIQNQNHSFCFSILMNLIVIDFLFHVFPSNMDKPQNTSSHHLRGTATKLMNLNQSCNIVKSNSSSRIEGSCNKLKDEQKPQELPQLPLHVSKPPTTTKQNSTCKLTQKIVRSRKRKRKQFFG